MKVTNVLPSANRIKTSAYQALIQHEKASEDDPVYLTRSRPARDEQALEALIRTLAVAMFTERETLVTVWSEYEDQTFRGIITKLDKSHKTIRIENEEEYTWVPFDDVIGLEILLEHAEYSEAFFRK